MSGFSALHKLATRNTIRQFANKHHLVYFGTVDAYSDEHQLVRGVTAAATHSDSHYTVGTFNGHDLILVERRNSVSHPGMPTTKHHWLVLQLDLKHGDWPHVFIDSHHDQTFHSNLRIGHAKLGDVTSLVPKLGHSRILAPVEHLEDVRGIISNDFVAAMHSFKHFDFEINDDQLYVYAHNPIITTVLLTDMLRVGAWLADYLDALQQKIPV